MGAQASFWGLFHHRGFRVAWRASRGHGRASACQPTSPLPFPPGVPTIVSRKEWGARSLTCRAQLTRPVAYVITDQIAGMECEEQNACSQKLRGLQSRSVYTKGWCDVAYK